MQSRPIRDSLVSVYEENILSPIDGFEIGMVLCCRKQGKHSNILRCERYTMKHS